MHGISHVVKRVKLKNYKNSKQDSLSLVQFFVSKPVTEFNRVNAVYYIFIDCMAFIDPRFLKVKTKVRSQVWGWLMFIIQGHVLLWQKK